MKRLTTLLQRTIPTIKSEAKNALVNFFYSTSVKKLERDFD